MKIGVVGNGVVGGAIAKWLKGLEHEVRVYDVEMSRRVDNEADTLSSELIFVCLPTPQAYPLNACDVRPVEMFFRNLPDWAKSKNYVLKSTVPIGTTKRIHTEYGITNLVHSPEFLTARTAEEDAANPRINVIGDPSQYHARGGSSCGSAALEGLITNIWGTDEKPLLYMSSDESEAVKLFMNAFFATKVSFFNELRSIADKLGLHWSTVREAMVEEGRIHPLHTEVPGPDGLRGFGGSCLPKDLASLIDQAFNAEVLTPVMLAAKHRNKALDRKEGGS